MSLKNDIGIFHKKNAWNRVALIEYQTSTYSNQIKFFSIAWTFNMTAIDERREEKNILCAIRMRCFFDSRGQRPTTALYIVISRAIKLNANVTNTTWTGKHFFAVYLSSEWRKSFQFRWTAGSYANTHSYSSTIALTTAQRFCTAYGVHLRALINSVNLSSWIMDLAISEPNVFVHRIFVDWVFLNRFIFM